MEISGGAYQVYLTLNGAWLLLEPDIQSEVVCNLYYLRSLRRHEP